LSNPLKIKVSSGSSVNSTNFSGLQEMTNAELDYVTNIILEDFASTNTVTGDLNITTGTSIGSFVDTRRTESIGTHPATGSTNTVATTFYQNVTSISESGLVRPLGYTGTTVKEQTDTDLNNTLIKYALDKIANTSNYATGQYYFGSAAPAGGTWAVKASVTDTLTHDSGTNQTYNLYRKTDDGISHTNIPTVKLDGSLIKQMSTAEIQSLTQRLRNRIVATGIGTYKLQASAPGTGTWVQVSDSLIDQVADNTSQQYSNQFTGNFSRQFTRQFTAQYTRQFARSFTADYTRSFNRQFTAQYTGQYTRIYSAQYGRQFTRQYTAQYTGQFTRIFSANYGRSFNRQFTGDYARQFTRIFTAQYTRAFARTFTGDYARQFTRIFSAAYGRSFNRQYTVNTQDSLHVYLQHNIVDNLQDNLLGIMLE